MYEMDHKGIADAVGNEELLNLYQIKNEDNKQLVGGQNASVSVTMTQTNNSSSSANNQSNVELCLVCSDRASGRHYGAISCEGCKGFFKRSIRKQLAYQCRGTMNCEITKHHRNRCQYCRLQKCLACGMRSDSVQHERKPLVDKKDPIPVANSGQTEGMSSKPFPGGLGSMFPVGMSFAELTSTLAQRGILPNSYQERLNASLAGLTGSTGNISAQFDNDENSMDNLNHSQSNDNIFQSAIDKNILSEANDIISSIQFEGQNNNDFDEAIKEEPESNNSNSTDDLDEFEEELLSLPDPFLMNEQLGFNLQPPSIVPSYLNIHYVCECGSRILFLSIFWLQKFHPFRLLSIKTQTILLQNCWIELFIMGFTQSSHTVSIATVMSSLSNFMSNAIAQEKMPASKLRKMSEHIWKVNEYVQELTKLDLADYEYALMRMFALFNPDNVKFDHRQRTKIAHIQELYMKVFLRQKQQSTKNDPDGSALEANSLRLSKLLLKLNTLRSLDPDLIEELFFSNLIGTVQIENVIPHILKLGNNCSND